MLARMTSPAEPTPRVFVASSAEALDLARVVTSELSYRHRLDPTLWEEFFAPSEFNLAELERAARTHPFGVFVLRADDLLWSRGVSAPVPRTNVLVEFLLFVGRNGRRRCVLLRPSGDIELPSDLDGLTHVPYDADRAVHDPVGALQPACDKVAAHLRSVAAADAIAEAAETARILEHEQVLLLDELWVSAIGLRDLLDALQRDTLEGLADRKKFEATKRRTSEHLNKLSEPQQARADRGGVGDEYREVRTAIASAIVALPYPAGLEQAMQDISELLRSTPLGTLPDLEAAIKARDIVRALDVLLKMRSRVTLDSAAQAAVALLEATLRTVRDNYARWWDDCSARIRAALTELERESHRRIVDLARRRPPASTVDPDR